MAYAMASENRDTLSLSTYERQTAWHTGEDRKGVNSTFLFRDSGRGIAGGADSTRVPVDPVLPGYAGHMRVARMLEEGGKLSPRASASTPIVPDSFESV